MKPSVIAVWLVSVSSVLACYCLGMSYLPSYSCDYYLALVNHDLYDKASTVMSSILYHWLLSSTPLCWSIYLSETYARIPDPWVLYLQPLLYLFLLLLIS